MLGGDAAGRGLQRIVRAAGDTRYSEKIFINFRREGRGVETQGIWKGSKFSKPRGERTEQKGFEKAF